MGIKNGTIIVGHIAGDPKLTYSEKTGTPRFYARVRVSDSLCAGAWFTSSPRIGRGKPRLVG